MEALAHKSRMTREEAGVELPSNCKKYYEKREEKKEYKYGMTKEEYDTYMNNLYN